MDGFESRAFQVIRETLIGEGRICEHTNDDGPTIIVSVDDVADKIESALLAEGLVL